MFCTKCGNVLEENDLFCPACGEKVDKSVVDNVEAQAEAVVNQPEINFENVADVNPKNRKKKFVTFGIIGAAAAVVAVVGIFVWPYISNFFVKATSDPNEYYQHIELNNLDNLTSSVATMVGSVNDEKGVGIQGEYKIKIGEMLIDDIEELTGADKSNYSWISEIGVTHMGSTNNERFSENIGLKLNNTSIISFEIVMDNKLGQIYLRCPELNQKFALVEIPESDFDFSKIQASLPSEEDTAEILERYLAIAIESINNVSQNSTTVTASGISQNCTELVAIIDDNTIKAIVKNVLNEFKNDQNIKSIMQNFYETAETDNFEDIYDEMLEEIDKLIDDIDEAESNDDLEIKITTWVNGKGEVIGRKFDVEDICFKHLTTNDGSDVGIDFSIFNGDDKIALTGTGEAGLSSMDAKLKLTYDDASKDTAYEYLNIEIKDYEINLFGDDDSSGEIIVTLADDTLSMISKEIGSNELVYELLEKGSIKLKFDISSNGEGNIELALLVDGNDYISISYTAEEVSPEFLDIPSDAINLYEENEAEEYIKDFDSTQIIKNLETAGVPKDILDYVNEFFDELDNLRNKNSYNDNYYTAIPSENHIYNSYDYYY